MKDFLVSAIWMTVYAGATVAAATQPISEEQAAVYAISAGLAGGASASILGSATLTWRGVLGKVLSSGAIAPMLVLMAIRADAGPNGVVYTMMPVVAYSLVAGLFGWMLVSLAMAAINKIKADAVLSWARGFLPRGWSGKGGDS